MDSSTSDIQELYRTHVHEKRILKGNMRVLEQQTVKTLKNLSAESRQFKDKFSKYIKGRRRNSIHDLPLRMKSSAGSEANRPMSRDLVCNECPYSFETWNNLIDVTRDGIDCYKSEILFGDSKCKKSVKLNETNRKEHTGPVQSGMLTEIPGFRRNLGKANRLSVSASVLVGNSPGSSPRSARASPRSPWSPVIANPRKSSMTSRKTHEATIADCEKLKIDHNEMTEVPAVRVSSVDDIHLPSQAIVGKGMDGLDELDTYDEEFHRGRSHTIDNHVKPVLLKRRKQLENQVNDYSTRRSTLASVTLKMMADAAKGKAKLKYLTRLIQDLPITGYEEHMGGRDSKEDNSLPDIYETMKNCRYLRSPPTSRRGSNAELTDEERYKWS